MKRIIQAVVAVSLITGAQAALAFPSSGDDVIPQFQSSYSDQYANKGAPTMQFPSSDSETVWVGSSTYADRHANEIARAPMVFPSSDSETVWAGSATYAERLAAGASDPALSE